MPTYEYVCDYCGYEFERFQSITAKALRKCPNCGSMGLKRLIGSGAGIIFKGSGFYETDYRSEGYKKAANSDKVKPEKGDTEKKAGAQTKSEIKCKDSKPKKRTAAGADDKKVSA